jgi:hypothetical protein
MVRDVPSYCQSRSDRPAQAGPAAHFDRNERHVISGQDTRLWDGNEQSLVCDGRKPVKSIDKS